MKVCRNCKKKEGECTCASRETDLIDSLLAVELGIIEAEILMSESGTSDFTYCSSFNSSSGFGGGDSGGGGAGSDF